MKKLRLDQLTVDSFVTSSRPAVRGTVAAHETFDNVCWTNTNSVYTECPSCQQTCTYQPYCNDDTVVIGTKYGVSCNASCANGATDCGTCAGQATCGPEWGCTGGTSHDAVIC